jgi:hypothetical protein
MKNNATADEKFMGGKVVEFVRFLADRVPEKNKTCSSRSKFMCSMHFSSICKATENFEMGVIGNLVVKSFKGGFIRKKLCRQTID